VFALAAIAYELLTGRRPAGNGAQIGAMTGAVLDGSADAVHAVLAQATDDDPSRRFPSALAFVSALEAASAPAAAGAPAIAALPVAPRAPAADAPPHDAPAVPEPISLDDVDFDDVGDERDEDEAHHQLTLLEQQAEPDRFAAPEDEAEADADRFVLDAAMAAADEPHPRFGSEEFRDDGGDELRPAHADRRGTADRGALGAAVVPPAGPEERPADAIVERGAPSPAMAAEPAPSASYYRRDVPAPVPGRGVSMLPIAITALVCLLLGFVAGYAVGQRGVPDSPVADAQPQPEPRTAAAPEGKPFSEQTVTPPAGGGTTAPAGAPGTPTEAAEPPAPAAAAPTTGQLIVRSTPAGAAVTVNGEWRGRTPLTIDDLPLARHDLRVVQEGYRVWQQTVALSADDPARTVSMQLERQPRAAAPPPRPRAAEPQPPAPAARSFTGSLYVDSRPRGASVYLDGKRIGTTPMRLPEVPIGSHVVRLELPDHRTWAVSTRVASGEEARVTGSLDRIR
jgi:hypothetical protein